MRAEQLLNNCIEFLRDKYTVSEQTFTLSSPFYMILAALSNLCELILTYISHSQAENSIATAQYAESIHGLAQLAGHTPFRGSSAAGKIRISLTPASGISGSEGLKILNHTRLSINHMQYFIELGSPSIKLLRMNELHDIDVINGEYEEQTFTSDGTALQSFNPVVKSMTDHDRVNVYVNGVKWKCKDSLYDMLPDEEAYVLKSSINVGIAVVFGNSNFGKIPDEGSSIRIEYIKTDGMNGNIYPAGNYNIEWSEDGYTVNGAVNLNEVLNTMIVLAPNGGADFEDPNLTKLMAPHTSKAFVLASPDNYYQYLSRYQEYNIMNIYSTRDDSHIEDDNVVYMKMMPNVKRLIDNSNLRYDYFTYPGSFVLSDFDKHNIYNLLTKSNRMLLNTEPYIIDPIVKKFIINVVIRKIDGYSEAQIRSNIKDAFNYYFLNIIRKDIIPLSDLVAIVEQIEGVDTCMVFFMTQDNEEAIVNRFYKNYKAMYNPITKRYDYKEEIVHIAKNEVPNIGMNTVGDIIIGENEVWVPRGGWTDRSGNKFEELYSDTKLSNLNVLFVDTTPSDIFNSNTQHQLEQLRSYIQNLS